MFCGTEAGSYLRLIDSCITQLKAQGPSRTCNESKKEKWGAGMVPGWRVSTDSRRGGGGAYQDANGRIEEPVAQRVHVDSYKAQHGHRLLWFAGESLFVLTIFLVRSLLVEIQSILLGRRLQQPLRFLTHRAALPLGLPGGYRADASAPPQPAPPPSFNRVCLTESSI